MSRGPGKVQRAIRELFEAEPDSAFTIGEICMRIYPGINRHEKRHRVAALRALGGLVKDMPELAFLWNQGRGGTRIYFNQTNVMSYALARMKSDWYHSWQKTSDEDLRVRLGPGGKEHDYVKPGGHWHRHVEIERARLAGDAERLAELQAIQDEVNRGIDRQLRALKAAL